MCAVSPLPLPSPSLQVYLSTENPHRRELDAVAVEVQDSLRREQGVAFGGMRVGRGGGGGGAAAAREGARALLLLLRHVVQGVGEIPGGSIA